MLNNFFPMQNLTIDAFVCSVNTAGTNERRDSETRLHGKRIDSSLHYVQIDTASSTFYITSGNGAKHGGHGDAKTTLQFKI